MKDSLTHAITLTQLLERDIARISINGNEAQQGLASDCAEHRLQLANKLRQIQHIESMEAIGSESVYKSYEQSAKAGDFNAINDVDDDSYMRHAKVADNSALAAYRKRVNRIGWILAATGGGVVLGVGKIIFDLIS
jgi:hypothetical protein